MFTAPEPICVRFKDRPKTGLVTEAANMRPRKGSDPITYRTNLVIRGLAKRIQGLNTEIKTIDQTLRLDLLGHYSTALHRSHLRRLGSRRFQVAGSRIPNQLVVNALDPSVNHELGRGPVSPRGRSMPASRAVCSTTHKCLIDTCGGCGTLGSVALRVRRVWFSMCLVHPVGWSL